MRLEGSGALKEILMAPQRQEPVVLNVESDMFVCCVLDGLSGGLVVDIER